MIRKISKQEQITQQDQQRISQQDLQQMRLTNGSRLIPEVVVYFLTVSLLILTFCEMALIGKNLTYTTKFTPSESQQNSLRNQTYITQAQALILFISILYTFLVPATTYSCFKHKRKALIPILMVTIGMGLLLVVLNIYFLTGASMYRNYMNDKYYQIQDSGVCKNGKGTLCMIGTCNRMGVFEQAKSMAIAFAVINVLFLTVYGFLAMAVNKRKKDSTKMELIV